MPASSNQGVELVSMDDVDRILRVTDALNLHRDWVIIPVDAMEEPRLMQQPDGKVLIHAPVREKFEAWIQALPGGLRDLDLGRVPNKIVYDPNLGLTGPYGPSPKGTRGYLGTLGVVR